MAPLEGLRALGGRPLRSRLVSQGAALRSRRLRRQGARCPSRSRQGMVSKVVFGKAPTLFGNDIVRLLTEMILRARPFDRALGVQSGVIGDAGSGLLKFAP